MVLHEGELYGSIPAVDKTILMSGIFFINFTRDENELSRRKKELK